jgi:hypothetical protein
MTVRTVERTWRTDGSESADDQSIAVAVMEAISESTADWTHANEPTLYDYIDPDALESMLAHAGSNAAANWEVQFDADEYTVTITSDGQVTVN